MARDQGARGRQAERDKHNESKETRSAAAERALTPEGRPFQTADRGGSAYV